MRAANLTLANNGQHKHCYLFALEVQPIEVGAVYDEPPRHCTLMRRFLSGLPHTLLADKAQVFFDGVSPVKLIPHKRLLLGLKQVPVSELVMTDELRSLHVGLYSFLNDLQVAYTDPEWVGE